MSGCIAPTESASTPFAGGSSSTIDDVLTPRWEATRRSAGCEQRQWELHLDVASALTALCDANPQAIVFGTDLPSTRAKRPFRDSDVDLILDCLGDEVGRLVLLENGLHLY